MNVLILNIHRIWFDSILSDFKKEEYRVIKSYWLKRLMVNRVFKKFDCIEFRNGYSKNADRFRIECLGIEIGVPVMEWGGNLFLDKKSGILEECIVIKLGKII